MKRNPTWLLLCFPIWLVLCFVAGFIEGALSVVLHVPALVSAPYASVMALIATVVGAVVWLFLGTTKKEKTQMNELKGVHGWLWWFVYIVLGLVGTGFNFLYLVSYAAQQNFAAALIVLPFVGTSLVAAVLLAKENPTGVKWAKVYLLMNVVGGMGIAVLNPQHAYEGLRLVVLSTLWLGYLLTSKRVRNTYAVK